MNLLDRRPVTLAEAKSLITALEEKPVLHDYFKKFSKLSKSDADKLVADLRALNSLKIKEEHMVKVADFLPQNAEELQKIFNDVSLSEDEINAVLNIIKNY